MREDPGAEELIIAAARHSPRFFLFHVERRVVGLPTAPLDHGVHVIVAGDYWCGSTREEKRIEVGL